LEQFREPLNLIRNYVHILQEQQGYLDPSEVTEALTAIEEQVEFTLRALDDSGEPDAAPSVAGALPAYGLSLREIDVLSYVTKGMADKQIAAALGISIFTVNKHVGGILEKMQAASRTEAGVRAVQERIV
jgi:DNA-binding NarL/FixJ family response regulator